MNKLRPSPSYGLPTLNMPFFRMVVLAKLNEIVKEWIKQLSLEKVGVL